MAFTKHGHYIPKSPLESYPAFVSDCGGPDMCTVCATESSQWYLDNNPLFKETQPYKPAPIMQFFKSKHLPSALAAVAMPFEELATMVDEHVPNGPEKSVALRKLLEGKDAAVRASLDLV